MESHDINNSLALMWKIQKRIIELQDTLILTLKQHPKDVENIERLEDLIKELREVSI